jgi:AcrR family transcriptional regulator
MAEVTEKKSEDLFGGGVQPKNTREKLIFTAINLFHEHGFHAVGLDYILEEAKLTKSTFYNHFESRDELTVEAVKVRDKWEMEAFMKAVQDKAGYDPKAMLLAMFDVIDDWFNNPDYKGCLFITACSEFPEKNHPVKRAASSHYADATEGIRKMAEGTGVKHAEAFAKEWVLLLEGATVFRQITDDNSAAQYAKRIAEARLADYLEQE